MAPPPGPLSSFLLNAYYLFGATSSDITAPAQSIYISERRDTFCDVHYHPWLGEVEDPLNSSDTLNPIAVSPDRHNTGSNHSYSEGHAKWRPFTQARLAFQGHTLYGEFLAF